MRRSCSSNAFVPIAGQPQDTRQANHIRIPGQWVQNEGLGTPWQALASTFRQFLGPTSARASTGTGHRVSENTHTHLHPDRCNPHLGQTQAPPGQTLYLLYGALRQPCTCTHPAQHEHRNLIPPHRWHQHSSSCAAATAWAAPIPARGPAGGQLLCHRLLSNLCAISRVASPPPLHRLQAGGQLLCNSLQGSVCTSGWWASRPRQTH